MRRARRITWDRIKTMALRLGLPGVEETTSWGQPTLKAHGKLWVWWSPHEDAPVFKVSFEEREILVEAEPSTFFFTAHYKSHPLVLVRPEEARPRMGEGEFDQGLACAGAQACAEGLRSGAATHDVINVREMAASGDRRRATAHSNARVRI
jgi:hypothetical protein